jgi:protein-S-isoprenylcysteine O-methyltransferase Ste14
MAELPVALQASVGCWFALEIALLIRDLVRSGRDRLWHRRVPAHDRGTRLLVSATVGGGLVLAWLLRAAVPGFGAGAPTGFEVAGLVLFWFGLATRIWAVLALGGSFGTFVRVDRDQPVVSTGPYRWVRHPSYTGLLLICLGFGVTAGNWLSLVASLVLPVLGVLVRIRVEEAELVRVLDDRYREYRRGTRRLLPGVW